MAASSSTQHTIGKTDFYGGDLISKSLEPNDNDGRCFFEVLGDSVVTGVTLTNVNDFRMLLIKR